MSEKSIMSLQKIREVIKERMKNIKYKIMVLSGKGGVGKSMVTANLAVALSLKGYDVAILDADLHGPTIPKMFGIENKKITGFSAGIIPVTTGNKISIVSIDFILPSEDTPVVWRGPIKTKAIIEFLSSVVWGYKDFLLIDLPPGTGDEALSIAQFIPNVDGVVIVTIPSLVSQHVVRKAISFAQKLDIPILGIIENMSYFRCPQCGQIHHIFGEKGGEAIAEEMNIDFLGAIPIDRRIAECSDKGESFLVKYSDSEIVKSFMKIAEQIIKKVENRKNRYSHRPAGKRE
ncbi:MAG: ATP-binding protein [Thermoprotei archaeon]|nr:MAG: ATP-binding protein [Thermoprotei archaeon]